MMIFGNPPTPPSVPPMTPWTNTAGQLGTAAGSLNGLIQGSVIQPTMVKPATHRRKTKLALALGQLATAKPTEFERKGISFYTTETDTLVMAMGKLKPMFNGRPQGWVQMLLNTVPAPYRPEGAMSSIAYQCFGRGILYTMPYIPGRRRTTFRLTAAGLGLLDYYAEKHPRFRPFHEAFITDEARNEIKADCFDLAFAIVPKRIEADMLKQEKQIEAIRIAKHKTLQEELRKQQLLLNQQYQAMQANLQNRNWNDIQNQQMGQYRQGLGINTQPLTGQSTGITGYSPSMMVTDELANTTAADSSMLSTLLKRLSPWK